MAALAALELAAQYPVATLYTVRKWFEWGMIRWW
jgi:hypothetical protein